MQIFSAKSVGKRISKIG